MEPSFQIVGDEGQKPVGLCGSGIIDVIAELFRCQIVSPKGKFIREGKRVRHDQYGIGSYVLALKKKQPDIKMWRLTKWILTTLFAQKELFSPQSVR